MEDLRRRMTDVEKAVADLRVQTEHIESATVRQDELLSKISGDTADIRALLQGGKVFGRVVAWTSGIAAAAAAIWHYLKDGFR